MKRFQWVFSIATAVALGACGGDAAVAILGTLGAGGGEWFIDADPATTGYQRADCSGAACEIIFSDHFYQRSYAEAISGNDPAHCNGAHDGTVTDSVNISVPLCFVGRFLSANEALSTNGQVHLYHDFDPRMSEGVWVDIRDDGHRFVFSTVGTDGCEIAGSGKKNLSFKISLSNFAAIANRTSPAPKLVSTTTVETLTIVGSPARTFVGEFVGASGLRLTRSGETIELQRREQVDSCS